MGAGRNRGNGSTRSASCLRLRVAVNNNLTPLNGEEKVDMSEIEIMPELAQLIGAMIFCSDRAVSTAELKRCLHEVADMQGGAAAPFGELTGRDVRAAVNALREKLDSENLGFHLAEVAGGFRLQSDSGCAPWVRHMLKSDKPNRLSRPALETLAIIAYRQPASRAEIESVRGVSVGHLVKSLMEMQLVRICGRSEMPGRPFLYGTTTTFLDHFGLKSVEELKKIDPSLVLSGEKRTTSKRKKEGDTNTEEPVAELPLEPVTVESESGEDQ